MDETERNTDEARRRRRPGADVSAWRARPVLARVSRVCAAIVPTALAAGVGVLFSRVVPRPTVG